MKHSQSQAQSFHLNVLLRRQKETSQPYAVFDMLLQSQAQSVLLNVLLQRTRENLDRTPSKCPQPLTRMSTEVNTEFECMGVRKGSLV